MYRKFLEGYFRKGVGGMGRRDIFALLECFCCVLFFLVEKDVFIILSCSCVVVFWKGFSEIVKEGNCFLFFSFGVYTKFLFESLLFDCIV